jgi:glycosyltransferase involved in cell wall biosynthesis
VLLADEPLAEEMGRLGRARAEAEFGWASIAAQTVALYTELAGVPLPG